MYAWLRRVAECEAAVGCDASCQGRERYNKKKPFYPPSLFHYSTRYNSIAKIENLQHLKYLEYLNLDHNKIANRGLLEDDPDAAFSIFLQERLE